MKKFLLYGVNGVINTAASYLLYVLLLQAIDYRIAVVISYCAAVGLSYALNGAIVFGTYGRFWLFALVSLFLLSLNLIITQSLVEGLDWRKEFAQLPAIAAVFVIGFFLNQRFVFNAKAARDGTSK